MSKTNRFVRVTAPGLPPRPRLWFHSERKLAKVRIRLATWRSWEWARRTVTLLRWSINAFVVWNLWQYVTFFRKPQVRIVLLVFGYGATYHLTRLFLPIALEGFFARQLFASTSHVWFSPRKIAFRSRLYETGITLDRNWRDHPIHYRFDITPDPDAILEPRPPNTQVHPSRSPGCPTPAVDCEYDQPPRIRHNTISCRRDASHPITRNRSTRRSPRNRGSDGRVGAHYERSNTTKPKTGGLGYRFDLKTSQRRHPSC